VYYPCAVRYSFLSLAVEGRPAQFRCVWATYCLWYSVKLTTEAFEMWKNFLTLSLTKPNQKSEAVLNTYDLYIYGDIPYTTNSFCKVLETLTLWPMFCIAFFNKFFLLLSVYFFLHMTFRQMDRRNYAYNYKYAYWLFIVTYKRIKFCRSCTHHMKGRTGMVYDMVIGLSWFKCPRFVTRLIHFRPLVYWILCINSILLLSLVLAQYPNPATRLMDVFPLPVILISSLHLINHISQVGTAIIFVT
jgi:hypothetical protein